MRVWIARSCSVLAVSCAVIGGIAMADEQKPAASVPAAPAETAPAKAQHVHRVAARPAKQSFFQRVMELERRKNAWLKRTFLGR